MREEYIQGESRSSGFFPVEAAEKMQQRRLLGCYGKRKLEETMELGKMLQQLTGGMLITTEIFILTLLFSLPLGLVLSFGRMSKVGVIRFLTKVYISIMRGTPLMLQLIVVYFAPYYVFGLKISQGYRMVAVILAFVLNYAAYFAEIYRSGIESMPVGQYEAAKML